MLNFVTEPEGTPAAVLLRAVLPQEGLERMRARRAGRPDSQLTDGPAKLCQAFAIDGSMNALDLCRIGAPLYLERGIAIPEACVTKTPRVGLNNVPEPWKSIPWRFVADLDRLHAEEEPSP